MKKLLTYSEPYTTFEWLRCSLIEDVNGEIDLKQLHGGYDALFTEFDDFMPGCMTIEGFSRAIKRIFPRVITSTRFRDRSNVDDHKGFVDSVVALRAQDKTFGLRHDQTIAMSPLGEVYVLGKGELRIFMKGVSIREVPLEPTVR